MTETVTLTKTQLEAIRGLLTQIEEESPAVSRVRGSPESRDEAGMSTRASNNVSRGSVTPSSIPRSELHLNCPAASFFSQQKFNSVHDLRSRNQTPTSGRPEIESREAPAIYSHVSPPGLQLQSPTGRSFMSPDGGGRSPSAFGKMTPVTSVPCFRRYAHRDTIGQDEWDQKRAKMLEYQSMLDQQREEIARRKAEEADRKRKEDAALEKKLHEQRERMRIEYEEEQRRQKEREECMEKKRQDVIQAIEKTSQLVKMENLNKKGAAGFKGHDTISLMSVDAVISSSSSKAVNEQMVKRTQSMYEVSSDDPQLNHTNDKNKEKTFTDACIQTDYSLLLSWLFNMDDVKDWQAFLQQRENAHTNTKSPNGPVMNHAKRSETRAIASQTDSEDTTSSSTVTLLSSSPKTFPIEKGKSNVTKFKPITSKKHESSQTKIPKDSASTHAKGIPQLKNRCKWNMVSKSKSETKSAGASHVKQSHDFRRRHTTFSNGIPSLTDPAEAAASSSDSVKAILNGEGGTGKTGKTKDFFTTGSDYHLSLSSTSPDPSSPVIRRSKAHLPAIHKSLKSPGHDARVIDDRKSLYARKKWMSHYDFGSSATFVVDKNDGSCFSRIEQITPLNPFI